MTWETNQAESALTPIFLFLTVVLLGCFLFLTGSPPSSLEERCALKGGEWLHGSTEPTCVLKDGSWLIFNDRANDFLLAERRAPEVLGEETALCPGGLETYPIEGIYGNSVARPDFSTFPEAIRYKTAITKDVLRGANFAGHYVLASWGCPEYRGCAGHAVIDTVNGNILAYGMHSQGGVVFTKESKLLVLRTGEGQDRFLLNEEHHTLDACTE